MSKVYGIINIIVRKVYAMALTDDYLTVCPFFRIGKMRGNIYHISCEPPKGVDSFQIGFYGQKLNTWRSKYCRNMDGYKDCPIAKMLLNEYSDKELTR